MSSLPTAAVSQASIRTGGDCDLCALVSPVFLSLRDLEELMAERGLCVEHTTIWRWVQAYGPESGDDCRAI